MRPLIGVDFDNTIVSYDDVIHKLAVQRGLVPTDVKVSKRHVRDSVRLAPDGEIEWQKLQAIVYGPRMEEATLIDGVQRFLEVCRRGRISVFIVSHKTEYANYDTTSTNLRAAALTWMRSKGLFQSDGLGLSERDVYFESTRRRKIERIVRLGCTHFIDDLEETFLEQTFPGDVEKILYGPHAQETGPGGVRVFSSWEEISDHFFAIRR